MARTAGTITKQIRDAQTLEDKLHIAECGNFRFEALFVLRTINDWLHKRPTVLPTGGLRLTNAPEDPITNVRGDLNALKSSCNVPEPSATERAIRILAKTVQQRDAEIFSDIARKLDAAPADDPADELRFYLLENH